MYKICIRFFSVYLSIQRYTLIYYWIGMKKFLSAGGGSFAKIFQMFSMKGFFNVRRVGGGEEETP